MTKEQTYFIETQNVALTKNLASILNTKYIMIFKFIIFYYEQYLILFYINTDILDQESPYMADMRNFSIFHVADSTNIFTTHLYLIKRPIEIANNRDNSDFRPS